jgi:uncharacterized membrane protein
MRFRNPLKMNDWELRQLLVTVFAVQFSLYVLIGFGSLGIDVFFLRPLIGLIYLTFIPGILLLRVFKIHGLSNVEALLYESGLSIATVMFIGLLSNTFFPFLGVDRPVTTVPLLAIFTAAVVVLCILAYIRDRDFSQPTFIETKGVVSPPALFLCIIPFVSIAGAQLMNIAGDNRLSLLVLVLIASVPLLMIFGRIPKKLYPLAVFVAAVALLLNVSLITPYVTGYDVQGEFFFATQVSTSGLWNASIPNDYNTVLSVAMLAPIISVICNLSIAVVFKWVYQAFFALVPLGLYLIYQRQTSEKAAFLSVFYFVSIFSYYAVMTQLMRQEIAELFVVLLILLIVETKMKNERYLLFAIFGFGLVVSHYSLAFLYIVLLIPALLLLASRRLLKTTRSDQTKRRDAIPIVFALLFIVLALVWYLSVGNSHAINTVASALMHGFNNIPNIFSLQPGTPIGVVLLATSPMRELTLWLSLFAGFLVVLGLLALIRRPREMPFTEGYFYLICANVAVIALGFVLPLLFQYNTLRAYQIALIVLAPLFVIGGMVFFKAITRIARQPFTKKWEKRSLTALSLFLAIFLLFNSGWIYTITNDNPTQYALNSHADAPRFSDQEMLAAKWVVSSKLSNASVGGDEHGWLPFLALSGPEHIVTLTQYGWKFNAAPGKDGILLYTSANLEGKVAVPSSSTGEVSLNDSGFFRGTITNSSLIYDDGGARAYTEFGYLTTTGGAAWGALTNLGGQLLAGTGPAAYSSGSATGWFITGTDHQLYWSTGGSCVNLGGNLTSSPAAASSTSGVIDVFGRGNDGALYTRHYSGGAWGAWENLGGQISAGTGPAASSWGAGRLDVFVRGANGALYHKWNTGSWSGWENLGGYLTSSPAAVSRQSGVIDVFARGNGAVAERSYFNGAWHAWANLGGPVAANTGPAASGWTDRDDLFIIGYNGALYQKTWTAATGWGAWTSLGGQLTSSPAATSSGFNKIDVFARGKNGSLYERSYM